MPAVRELTVVCGWPHMQSVLLESQVGFVHTGREDKRKEEESILQRREREIVV